MISDYKNTIIVISIFLLSGLIGMLAISYLPDFPFSDQISYDEIALKLLNEKRYTLSDGGVLAPGYPIFLSIIYLLFGQNYDYVYFIQFILLGIIGLLVYTISNKIFKMGDKISLIAAGSVILWPYLILYSSLLLSEILYTLVLCFIVYKLFINYNDATIKQAIFLGSLFALATLIRPASLGLPFWLGGFFTLFLLLNKTILIKKIYLLRLVTVIIVYIAFIAPWIIYASSLTGKFTPIVSYLSTMTSKANYGFEYKTFGTEGYDNPDNIGVQKLVATRLRNLYRFWKSGASGYQAELLVEKIPFTKYLIILYRIIYYIIIFMAFLSLFHIKRQPYILLIWMIIMYFWLLHSMLYPYPRYTLPLIPLVIILATYSVNNLNEIKKNC